MKLGMGVVGGVVLLFVVILLLNMCRVCRLFCFMFISRCLLLVFSSSM